MRFLFLRVNSSQLRMPHLHDLGCFVSPAVGDGQHFTCSCPAFQPVQDYSTFFFQDACLHSAEYVDKDLVAIVRFFSGFQTQALHRNLGF